MLIFSRTSCVFVVKIILINPFIIYFSIWDKIKNFVYCWLTSRLDLCRYVLRSRHEISLMSSCCGKHKILWNVMPTLRHFKLVVVGIDWRHETWRCTLFSLTMSGQQSISNDDQYKSIKSTKFSAFWWDVPM